MRATVASPLRRGRHGCGVYAGGRSGDLGGLAGGLSLPLIGALLGHLNPRTTQRYPHLADDPRRVAADRVATEIGDALRGKPAAKVKLLKRGKA